MPKAFNRPDICKMSLYICQSDFKEFTLTPREQLRAWMTFFRMSRA